MITQNKPDREEVIEKLGHWSQGLLNCSQPGSSTHASALLLQSALSLLTQQREDENRLENLLECYEAIACQNRCGCLHPACKNCQRDQDLDESKSAMASTSTTEEESA